MSVILENDDQDLDRMILLLDRAGSYREASCLRKVKAERDHLHSERTAMIQNCERMVIERDRLRVERDSLRSERDKLIEGAIFQPFGNCWHVTYATDRVFDTKEEAVAFVREEAGLAAAQGE